MNLLLTLFATLSIGAGDIYRCRGADGVVRFEDQPCKGMASQKLANAGEDPSATRLELMRFLRDHKLSTGAPARAPDRPVARPRLTTSGPGNGPVSEAQLAVCSERFLKCAHGTGSVMDGCVARLPRCGPGVASNSCCPQACVSRYQRLRQQGHPLASAVRLALLDPDAYACAN
jgi:hypothetical protein